MLSESFIGFARCKRLQARCQFHETTASGRGHSRETHFWRSTMLKFLGGTVGIIFLIGLIVVIALFKLVF
ncbi:hypothetical protein IFR09_09020 [Pseudomonas syringae]|nr:hypothetical protein [Pseudomonas syringae]MBD8575527.1 hypothetical protein [Pseudomonas syringae]MBD8788694.1 hypothetical protein [Pseudomonas syringae]MBD8801752.1 hypothetical protein [Pseudomonas syringae]MBD8811303.1 hypothetical protein [Pseudomonas syringae]